MKASHEHLSSSLRPELRGWPGRVVYQIYPRTFNEAQPDNIEHSGRGNLRGVIEKVPYLAELGVGAIWLSPFYTSPLIDGGYDIADYRNVNPDLGTLETAEELFATAHKHDIRTIIDLVPNHTSDQHEWFQREANRKPNRRPDGSYDPTGDFYHWHDPKRLNPGDPLLPRNIIRGDRLNGLPPGFTVPNNWSSIFSEPERERLQAKYGGHIPEEIDVPALTAWVWHPGRGQFYLAEFAKEQPSLNWNNLVVREAMKDVMRFWIDKGVDGFRVDVMNHIGKDPTYADEVPVPEGTFNKNTTNPHDQWTQARLVSSPQLEEYAEEMISVLDEYAGRDLRIIAEDWMAALDGEDRISPLRPDKATAFNFDRLLRTNRNHWNAAEHKQTLDTYYARPEIIAGLPNQVDSNHDVDRVVSRLGYRPALAAAVIKLTTPGSPYIFQGEEGGLPNVPYEFISPERRQDTGLAFRDGERCPIPWNRTDLNAGFSDAPEPQLWLPIDPRYREFNLADQQRDPRSPLRINQAIIHKRNTSPELARGSYEPMTTDHDEVLAFGRPHPEGERRRYMTLVNFSGNTEKVAIINPQQAFARAVLSTIGGTDHDHRKAFDLSQPIQLAPYEALVLQPEF